MADEEKDSGKASKADLARIKDTNVEGLGSKENRDLKKKAAETEKAWKGAGEEAGLQIWRIEKFKVKKWPKKKYGQFHTGDSYIILQTIEDDQGKDYNAFFWLGADTTQDEAGTAAYKTVELDDLLGDEPVQYREVQGNESKLFIDLFEKLKILPGGVATGFRKVTDEKWDPSLHHVCGHKKHVQVYDVTKKGVKALNQHDSFVLDCKDNIYIFNGPKATAWEKRMANQFTQETKGDPGRGKSKDSHVDWADDEKDSQEFWDFFGGKPDELPEEEEQVSAQRKMKMIKISDDDGTLKATVVADDYLHRKHLESDDAYILDTGISIYIWIGKTCKASEKKECMKHVMEYMKENDIPLNVPVCRVMEKKEPKHFQAMIKDCEDGKWDAKMIGSGFCGRMSSRKVQSEKK